MTTTNIRKIEWSTSTIKNIQNIAKNIHISARKIHISAIKNQNVAEKIHKKRRKRLHYC